MNWQFYKSGDPIMLMTLGEVNAYGYEFFMTNHNINATLLEYRFFGYSNPYDNVTAQSLALLTIQQAIDDLVYFATTADLLMPRGGGQAPWILVGGSYSGALASYTMVNKPRIFWAGYLSSATVETITDYYDYLTPVREYMPQNCSFDVQAVIAYLDGMYVANDTAGIQALQAVFSLNHVGDSLPHVSSMFYRFCDALEVKDGVNAGSEGWGLGNVITPGVIFGTQPYTYSRGLMSFALPDGEVRTCLRSFVPTDIWTNVTVDNPNRSWLWIWAPEGQSAIVSRIIQPSFMEINIMCAGWSVNALRIFLANGLRDRWRGGTVSADGLNKPNTTSMPIYMSDAFYTSDMMTYNGIINPTIAVVQEAGLIYMKEWLAEWKPFAL
ncbi:hypothetical protein BDR04DRAFT_1129870 [Suillus decipiens]|nr:hypothetical protein BDR04DRAFT_1129870 [Suillus decipiens]